VVATVNRSGSTGTAGLSRCLDRIPIRCKNPAICLALIILVFATIASAQDGKLPYEQLCGACHGNDGRGGQEGQIPPLADSDWVKGASDRMIQVVLHGLMGEITVASKHATLPAYDLVMPPQGAALTDEQIAGIVNYVRSSWGNKESAVTVAMVEVQRQATNEKKDFWQAAEILEKHPLKQKPQAVETRPEIRR